MSKIGAINSPIYTPTGTMGISSTEPADPPSPVKSTDPSASDVAPSNTSGILSHGSSPEGQAQKAAVLAQSTGQATGSFDDNYWSQQPPEVQQLRYIDDADERQKIAGELIAKGYKIDVPIMVWGWSPETTTGLRQAYGYTWVPSAMQDSIKIAPGLNMPGVAAYDPDNPPPGSILVDTTPVKPGIMMKDFTSTQLEQQFDKPTFLNSRIADANPPTEATVTTAPGVTVPMNSALLSPLDQVVALQQRLVSLGFQNLTVQEQPPSSGAAMNWGNETRRTYSLGGVNAGLMLNQLARYPTDQALQLIAQQLANK